VAHARGACAARPLKAGHLGFVVPGKAVYYWDSEGFEPVRDFVDVLPEGTQTAIETRSLG
jgi:hypothetical protein